MNFSLPSPFLYVSIVVIGEKTLLLYMYKHTHICMYIIFVNFLNLWEGKLELN